MAEPIERQRLWVVITVFLLLGPFLGMLFLNRRAIFLGYFLGACALLVIGKVSNVATDGIFWLVVNLSFYLIGLVHGIFIAWQRDPDEPLKWFASWYTPAAFVGVVVVATLMLPST